MCFVVFVGVGFWLTVVVFCVVGVFVGVDDFVVGGVWSLKVDDVDFMFCFWWLLLFL